MKYEHERTEGILDSVAVGCGCFGASALFAALGLGGLHGGPADAARLLFFVFLVLGAIPVLRRARRETA
jgi:uncharacterized membrane protein YtjA (UPF0391 family)